MTLNLFILKNEFSSHKRITQLGCWNSSNCPTVITPSFTPMVEKIKLQIGMDSPTFYK